MILVTGFYYQKSTNASGVLVQSLKDELPDTLISIKDALAFEAVTCDETSRETEHVTLESQLNELLIRYTPAI